MTLLMKVRFNVPSIKIHRIFNATKKLCRHAHLFCFSNKSVALNVVINATRTKNSRFGSKEGKNVRGRQTESKNVRGRQTEIFLPFESFVI